MAALAGSFSVTPNQEKSKVSEVVRLTTLIYLSFEPAIDINLGKTLVFASPLLFFLVEIAQTDILSLRYVK